MAASIQVLCPNGRRQTVKVTPNTKLLQILEEVCQRQGFIPPEDFKLVFSSLPNNAKLELAKSTTSRVEQDVTIALQLDSGQRFQDSFSPSVTLWDLLLHFEEKHGDCKGKLIKMKSGTEEALHPVCIFMREEVIGEQALKATTLKKLALTSGKAIIRLLHRPVEESKIADICDQVEKDKAKQIKLEEMAQRKKEMMDEDQRQSQLKATLSESLTNVPEENESEAMVTEPSQQQQQPKKQQKQNQQKAPQRQQQSSGVDDGQVEVMDVDSEDNTLSSTSFSGGSSSKNKSPKKKTGGPISNEPPRQTDHIEELRNLNIPGVEIFTPDDFNDLSPVEQAIARRLAQRFLPHLQAQASDDSRSSHSRSQLDEQSSNAFMNFKFPDESKDGNSGKNSSSGKPQTSRTGPEEQSDDSPCERNIVIYDASESLPMSYSSHDLPDEFFTVTQSDVRLMYRDLQSAIQKMEDQPLMTKTLKQAQAEAAYDRYEQVVIRVHFPDKFILQACFKPREKVQALYSFVRDCLQEKNLKFYLYTTPPKTVLKDMKTSLAVNHLAPAALIYFGCDQEREHYIQEELMDSIQSRMDAETSVAEVLKNDSRVCLQNTSYSGSTPSSSTDLHTAGPSGMSGRAQTTATSSTPQTLPSGAKVPKWLKLGKK